MSCACNGPCSCAASVPVGPRGFRGPAGPANNLTFSVIPLPAGSPPTVTTTGVPPNQHIEIGLPSGASPVFSVVANTLSAGSSATATINNTNPLAPIITFGIPRGADGADGWGTAFELLDSFNMPAPGATTGFVTVGDNRMVEVGTWVKITGFSIEGNWFVVTAKSGDDQIQLRNPGSTDLLPYWGAGPASIPANAPTGTLFSPGELGVVVGAPGLRGIQGASGISPQIAIVYAIPVSPPAPGGELVFFANAAPPSRATSFIPYRWNGVSWDAGPNVAGAPGSQTFFGTADPNVSSPSPSSIGDVYWRTQPSLLTAYQRTGPSTWTVQGALSLLGTATTDVMWTSGPGTYTLDLAVFSYLFGADKNLELDWDNTNYNGQGKWTVAIRNVDASPIDLTFAAGRWHADPALSITPPVSIASGDWLVIEFVRFSQNGYAITNLFVATAI